MAVLDAIPRANGRKPKTLPDPTSAIVSTDESVLRDRLVALDAELAGREAELAEAERERDTATREIEALEATGGPAIRVWQAEERYAAAEIRIREALAAAAPLKAQQARIAEFLSPLDFARTQLVQSRAELVAWSKLTAVLPLLDQIAAVVADATAPTTAFRLRAPGPLAAMLRQLGPDAVGSGRPVLVNAIESGIATCRATIARLGATLSAGPVVAPKVPTDDGEAMNRGNNWYAQ